MDEVALIRLWRWLQQIADSARRKDGAPDDEAIAEAMEVISATSALEGAAAFDRAVEVLTTEDPVKHASFIAVLGDVQAALPCGTVTLSKAAQRYPLHLALVATGEELRDQYGPDQPLAHPLAVLASLCSKATGAVTLPAFCDRVAEVMRKEERRFDDGYRELMAASSSPAPCMLDVGFRGRRRFQHFLFSRFRRMNGFASRPLGDLCTGAFSLPSNAAATVRRFLLTLLEHDTPALALERLVESHVDGEFDPAAVGRLSEQAGTYPALQYLRVAEALAHPGAAIQDDRLRRDFCRVCEDEGVKAHLEALVLYRVSREPLHKNKVTIASPVVAQREGGEH